MSPDAAPEPRVAPSSTVPSSSRLGRIVRWAARMTSIPVLAMLLLSLVPALLSFSVSAREDKVLALCLAVICVGLMVGWKWAGIGGGLIVSSIAVLSLQSDSSIWVDPFSVAFGLQGILFLLSWVLDRQPSMDAHRWGTLARGAGLVLLAAAATGGVVLICRGPGSAPIPKDKVPFVGVWENGAGFQIEITEAGRAIVSLGPEAKIEAWNSPVRPGETNEFNLTFRGDETLELGAGALSAAKVYQVDRPPHRQARQIRMVLNGSDPYKPGQGVKLFRKDSGASGAPSSNPVKPTAKPAVNKVPAKQALKPAKPAEKPTEKQTEKPASQDAKDEKTEKSGK